MADKFYKDLKGTPTYDWNDSTNWWTDATFTSQDSVPSAEYDAIYLYSDVNVPPSVQELPYGRIENSSASAISFLGVSIPANSGLSGWVETLAYGAFYSNGDVGVGFATSGPSAGLLFDGYAPANYTAFEGRMYDNGLPYTGPNPIDNMYYDDGYPFTGTDGGDGGGRLWISGVPAEGSYEGVLYYDGYPVTGYGGDGAYYQDGVLLTGDLAGQLFVDGWPFTGNYGGDNLWYTDGYVNYGFIDGFYWDNGSLATGWYDNSYWVNGSPADGVYDNMWFSGGQISSGLYEGVYYDGQYGPAYGLMLDGVFYAAGYPYTGWSADAGGYFVDGYPGVGFGIDGLLYDGYAPANYTFFGGVFYDSGVPFNGAAQPADTPYTWFNDGIPGPHNGVENNEESFGNDGLLANGLVFGLFFVDGYTLTGIDSNTGLVYHAGELAQGYYDDNSIGEIYYIDGVGTTLDLSGNGTWNGHDYIGGVRQIPPDGWDSEDEIYYLDGEQTTLDSNGDGLWQGLFYASGAAAQGAHRGIFYQAGELLCIVLGAQAPVALDGTIPPTLIWGGSDYRPGKSSHIDIKGVGP